MVHVWVTVWSKHLVVVGFTLTDCAAQSSTWHNVMTVFNMRTYFSIKQSWTVTCGQFKLHVGYSRPVFHSYSHINSETDVLLSDQTCERWRVWCVKFCVHFHLWWSCVWERSHALRSRTHARTELVFKEIITGKGFFWLECNLIALPFPLLEIKRVCVCVLSWQRTEADYCRFVWLICSKRSKLKGVSCPDWRP